MTSEETKAAIERLQGMRTADRELVFAVCRAFFDGGDVTGDELHYALIELLEQADPDTHMEVPKDADGEPINIGDEMNFCEGVRGLTVIGVGISSVNDSDMGVFVRDDDGYMWFNARFLHHHRAPTVEDMLSRFYIDCEDAGGSCSAVKQLATEYADKLREVMRDE